MRVFIALVLFGFTGMSFNADEPHMKGKGDAKISTPDNIKWGDAPPVLPKGAKAAILEGNPLEKGPFVLRLKAPDGYRVPPHVHSDTERVTVLSGTFYLGMGDTLDEKKGQAMPAGSYGYWPAGMKHFAWVKGETIIQIHGMGPWTITYLNPGDDPSKGRK